VRLRALRRIGLPIGCAALLGLLLLAFSAAAGAQTPTEVSQPTESQPSATIEPTPGPDVRTVVKITVDQAIQPIPKGQEFQAVVSVDDVEHLAGFDFTITYDPKRVQPVQVAGAQQQASTAQQGTPIGGSTGKVIKSANLGQFLKSGGRADIACSDPRAISGTEAGVLCTLLGAPLCFGGLPGVSGSGVLGSLTFKSKGGGVTTLKLAKSDLSLDNFAQCTVGVTGSADLPGACLPVRDAAGSSATQVSCQPDGTAGTIVEGPTSADDINWVRLDGLGWAQVDYLEPTGTVLTIPHRRVDATIELAKSSSNTMALVGVIIGVVAVVVVVGGGGYVWYRRRQSGSPPTPGSSA
jgi:hypothetical protein